MIHIELKNKQYRQNYESKTGFVTGTAFTKTGQMLSGEALMNYVASFDTANDLAQALPDLNGFYAFAVRKNGDLVAAVDRIRSIPLFYGQKGEEFFQSDSAEWIRKQIGDTQMDPMAREEFLTCGYVTGPDTLFPNVKQLQAGEALFITKNDEGLLYGDPQRYFRYLPTMDSHESEEGIFPRLDAVVCKVFERLIDFASGRTIVVPLSGGYDSRLIVLMLKRMRYENVVAFSYGRPGNHESEISKQVAGNLSIRWEFVEYSNELWREWYESPEMKVYFEIAGNLASLPHSQDWPAVKVLKEERRIPDNAVLVPGHTVVLAIQVNAVEEIWRKKKGEKAFFEMLRKSHYNLKQDKSNIHELRNTSYSDDFPMDTKEQVAAVGDSWAWTERQSKFIGNSVRVYEFFRHEWWMPFWDKEFVDYWGRTSYEARLNKALFSQFVDNLAKELGVVIQDKKARRFFSKNKLTPIAKRVLPTEMKKWVKKELEKRTFREHPMAWYGMFEDGYVRDKIVEGASTINSLLAIDYIKEIQKRETEY